MTSLQHLAIGVGMKRIQHKTFLQHLYSGFTKILEQVTTITAGMSGLKRVGCQVIRSTAINSRLNYIMST